VAALTLPRATVPGHTTQAFADLKLPADLPSGEHSISLSGIGGRSPVDLGALTVVGRPAVFEPPELTQPVEGSFGDVVGLLGVAATPELIAASPGQSVTVTLVWRALSPPDRELVRFVHALGPDGNPVAQHDATPCGGSCPAPSWRPGEVLTDPVNIVIPADAPPGEYPLAVGWFESASGERLPTYDAAGARLPGDVLPLPLRIVIAPAEGSP
jgi:hypothetical protein